MWFPTTILGHLSYRNTVLIKLGKCTLVKRLQEKRKNTTVSSKKTFGSFKIKYLTCHLSFNHPNTPSTTQMWGFLGSAYWKIDYEYIWWVALMKVVPMGQPRPQFIEIHQRLLWKSWRLCWGEPEWGSVLLTKRAIVVPPPHSLFTRHSLLFY